MYNDELLIENTNFNISKGICDILECDCIYFGYIKNNKPNMSGFINHLIYHLAQYREDLHSKFLAQNNNDAVTTSIIEKNIYNVYLKTFDISDDTKVNIQLRINKEHKQTFNKIFDKYLAQYNLDFTNYIRTLLLEYAIKPLFQREFFSIYIYSKILLSAQKHNKFVKIRTHNECITMVPVGIENDYLNQSSYVFGFTQHKEEIVIINYKNIKSVIELDDNLFIDNEDYDTILNTFKEFLDNNMKNQGE